MAPYSFYSSSPNGVINREEEENPHSQSPYLHSLHSPLKRSAKPWKKPSLAPPPRVYKVDSINFRKVVQKLTGAPDFRLQRLQCMAPSPLNNLAPLSGTHSTEPRQQLRSSERSSESSFGNMMSESSDANKFNFFDGSTAANSFESRLSPSLRSWCSFPLFSPGDL